MHESRLVSCLVRGEVAVHYHLAFCTRKHMHALYRCIVGGAYLTINDCDY